MTDKDAEEALEQAIIRYEHAMAETPALLTGWVLIGEFMDANGVPHLSTYAANTLPYWRVNGMIQAASDEIVYIGFDEIEDEYEDE
jgi:hypothetical protein